MPQPGIPSPLFSSKINKPSAVYGGGMALWSVYKMLKAAPPNLNPLIPYRPYAWSSTPRPVVIIDGDTNVYVFDAILKVDHTTSIRATQHPVQNAANISDHAFPLPEVLTFEVGMSDVMDNFFSGLQNGNPVKLGQASGKAVRWGTGDKKSISAYQGLKKLQSDRNPLSIFTRLNNYQNMLIEQMHAGDDVKTLHGLKCIVTMKQIFTAEVRNNTVKVSSRSAVSGSAPKAEVQPKPIGSWLSLFNK
jgi:hypothetical protein